MSTTPETSSAPSAYGFHCVLPKQDFASAVLAPIIFWCISCMAFMRGSIAAMGAGAAMLDMPGEAGAALMAPGLAHALARAATDKAMIVRIAVMVSS